MKKIKKTEWPFDKQQGQLSVEAEAIIDKINEIIDVLNLSKEEGKK